MRNKKRNRIFILIILLLGITIGFAILSTTLKINGTANLGVNQWDMHWASTGYEDGVTATTSPTISNDIIGTAPNTKTVANAIVTWEVELATPGDYYEFTIDAVNAGTIDAMVTDVSSTVSSTLPSYIKYSVTYEDGNPIRKYHKLAKATVANNTSTPTAERYKIRVEYDKNVVEPDDLDDIDENGDSYEFTFAVTYGQADEYAYDRNYSDLMFYDGSQGLVNVGVAPSSAALAAFTNDYTTIIDGSNNQRPVFAAAKFGANDVIEEGYACGIFDGELVCVKGPSSDDNQALASTTLPEIFGERQGNSGKGCVLYNNGQYYCYPKADDLGISIVVPDSNNSSSPVQTNYGLNYASVTPGGSQGLGALTVTYN